MKKIIFTLSNRLVNFDEKRKNNRPEWIKKRFALQVIAMFYGNYGNSMGHNIYGGPWE